MYASSILFITSQQIIKIRSFQGNTVQMDKLLSPVLQTIRKNKINSFIQLKNLNRSCQDKYSIFQRSRFSHSKTLQIVNKVKGQRASLLKYRNFKEKIASTIQQRKQINPQLSNNFITFFQTNINHSITIDQNHQNNQKFTGDGKITRNDDNLAQPLSTPHTAPVISTSMKKNSRLNSKIKRHLVSEVDMDQVEQKLYKKRQCMTRYDYFMQLMEQKKRRNSKNKDKPIFREKLKSQDFMQNRLNKCKTIEKDIRNQIKIKNTQNQSLINIQKRDPSAIEENCSFYESKYFNSPRKKFWFNYNLSSNKGQKNSKQIKNNSILQSAFSNRKNNISNQVMKNTTMVSSTGRRTLLNYNNNTNSGRRKGTDLALDQQFKYLQGRSINKLDK